MMNYSPLPLAQNGANCLLILIIHAVWAQTEWLAQLGKIAHGELTLLHALSLSLSNFSLYQLN